MNNVLQLITDQGIDGLAEGLRILVNQITSAERSQALQAQPYERTASQGIHQTGLGPEHVPHNRSGPKEIGSFLCTLPTVKWYEARR